jgi:hypothetical protein
MIYSEEIIEDQIRIIANAFDIEIENYNQEYIKSIIILAKNTKFNSDKVFKQFIAIALLKVIKC